MNWMMPVWEGSTPEHLDTQRSQSIITQEPRTSHTDASLCIHFTVSSAVLTARQPVDYLELPVTSSQTAENLDFFNYGYAEATRRKKSSQHVRIIPVIKQSSISCLHEAGVSTKQTPAPYCWYAERQINVCLLWVIQVECKLFRVGCCWYSVCVRVWAHEYTHM